MNKIIAPAQFDGYAPRKDGTFSLRFVTQEQTPQDVANLHQMLNGFGYLYFKAENALTPEEVKQLDELDTDLHDNAKTQSQRIRNILHVAYKQNDRGYREFKDFYKHMTERFIQKWKDSLED